EFLRRPNFAETSLRLRIEPRMAHRIRFKSSLHCSYTPIEPSSLRGKLPGLRWRQSAPIRLQLLRLSSNRKSFCSKFATRQVNSQHLSVGLKFHQLMIAHWKFGSGLGRQWL